MVFVLNADKTPLDLCHPARARQLLCKGQAAIFRRYPFTIILKEQKEDPVVHQHRIKIDPGSKVTGVAVLQGDKVVWAGELAHRGEQIRNELLRRNQLRRNRRSRKTRYRPKRLLNRRRKEGWLPPSLESRLCNTLTWTNRLHRFCPVGFISMELVKFDTQLMQNPEISGVEYQQGELQGYEVREYLLEKWGRKCAYCGKTNVPLEIEHIIPKSRGGTNRVSNLTLACHDCNDKKDRMTAAEFGHPEIQVQAKRTFEDVASVNITRWKLYERLNAIGLPVETGSGGLTKRNRTRLGLPKEHWIDASCVGVSTPDVLWVGDIHPLQIRAFGHGKRQRCRLDKHGFPVGYAPSAKSYMGFRTGDIVRAEIPKGKYAGEHSGRIAIRHRPCFRLSNRIDVHPKYLSVLQQSDGYSYAREVG